ncbi:MAG: hydroxymethylbilane synthase [Bdellovibrionaceae bacterium]|nr:hydroxymethylbilane synthase [Pseudobdellovibrionaceae bacterium]
MRLKISARKSDLARLQAYQVGNALKKKFAELEIQYNFRESLGDKNLTDPLWRMPEKGVFTEDFVQDLLDGNTDLVVHSWKDLPTAPRVGTQIVATMSRADQRDLLLFKKNDADKVRSSKHLKVFSSSPRRAYNLENFLKTHMPYGLRSVEFCNVRGNIQTRVRKMMEDPDVSALIVAKAAIDRLLTVEEPEFAETKNYLRACLQELNWMALPLSVNPNAAAQGALAIEIKNGRDDLLPFLKTIDCPETFTSAQKERDVLASFGGGCHQKIGVAILKRPYGELYFLKGLTDAGQVLNQRTIQDRDVDSKFSAEQMGSSKELHVSRTDLPNVVVPKDAALYITKSEAKPAGLYPIGLLWTAGLRTWEALAAEGLWVHGSSESLGEIEDPRVDALNGSPVLWTKLTHQGAADETSRMKTVATYQIAISTDAWAIGKREAFYWHSGSQFLAALAKDLALKEKNHFCGPGNTYKILRDKLGPEASIEVYLDEEDWRKSCSR